MTHFVLKDAYVAVGAANIRGFTNNLGLSAVVDHPETTAMGQQWRSRLQGLRDTTMNLQGFWDSGLDLLAFTALGAEDPTPVSLSGQGIEGVRGYTFKSKFTQYQPGGSVGEVFAYTIDANGTDPLIHGLLAANRTITADGAGPVLNLGALATGKTLFASFHVTANSGDGSQLLSAEVQSCPDTSFDGSVTTSRIAFTPVTTVNGAQFLSLAGPVTDAFWRLSWVVAEDSVGSNASFEIFSVIGIAISS